MPNPQKEREIEALTELLSSHNVQFITDHSGLSVAEITKLRAKLRETGTSMRVAKNRLIKLARNQAGLCPIDSILEGPSSLVLTIDDPISPAKVLKGFMDELNKPQVKAVIIDDILLDITRFSEIASLPGLDALRARVVSGITTPLSGLVFTMSGLLRGFVVALNGIAEKKEQA